MSQAAPVLDARRTAVAYTVGPEPDPEPAHQRAQLHQLLADHAGRRRGPRRVDGRSRAPRACPSRASRPAPTTSWWTASTTTTRTLGGVRGTFSQEAVREFQVLTDSYSAEFGKASGGVVNIVTHSGHQRAARRGLRLLPRRRAERPRPLRALRRLRRARSTGPRRGFGQWQWGGTLGGPIRKGQTFFFLSFERSGTDANNFVNIDQPAAESLQRGGLPGGAGQRALRQPKATQLLAKIDHQWSPRNTLVLRGSLFDLLDENTEPFGGIMARSAGAVQLRTDWFVSASETDVLSSALAATRRASSSRASTRSRARSIPRCDGDCDRTDEGGPAADPARRRDQAGRDACTPQPRAAQPHPAHRHRELLRRQPPAEGAASTSRYVDTAVLDAAVLLRRRVHLQPAARHRAGRARAAAARGAALGAGGVRNGLPGRYVQGYGQPGISYIYKELSAFVQDEWRVTTEAHAARPACATSASSGRHQHFDVSDVGGTRLRVHVRRRTRNNFAPRLADRLRPPRRRPHVAARRLRALLRRPHVGRQPASPTSWTARDGVRALHAVLPRPRSRPGAAPGHRAPEPVRRSRAR